VSDPRGPLTLEEAARISGAVVQGERNVVVRGVAPLAEAGHDQLGLLADRRYLSHLEESRAGALLVSTELTEHLPDREDRPRLVADDPHEALIPLLECFHPTPSPTPGIHPTAVVGPGVLLGVDVHVGPYAVLEEGAVVGDRARIGPHAVVGRGCRVGEDAVLHAHVTLYPDTVLGRRVVVHSGARLGVDGFGYAEGSEGLEKIPQVGRCVVEDDVEVGANTCVDRGSIGDTRIGRGTKIDNLVHLAHNVRIGAHSAMAAQVGIAGSTRVGAGVMFGGQAGVVGHVEIGDGARLSAQAGIIGDVEAGASVTGYPARDLRRYLRASALFLRLPELERRLRALEEPSPGALENEGDGSSDPGSHPS
jgi:UDP-3-O-[3-hydroxymyristoyl] glucosamine N-acyltransferase